MSRVEAAAADRLPWLPDEPAPRPVRRRGSHVLPWAAAALAIVAVAGFWMGAQSIEQQPVAPHRAAPSTTVRLPEARPAQPPEVKMPAQPEVIPAPEREVRPAPVHEVRVAAPPPAKPVREQSTAVPAQKVADEAPPAVAAPAPAFAMPKPWNPRIFAGAAGRVVQIGAFGSVHQSKEGWWHMVHAYPAMSRLPAVVRPTRNSKGKIFYRFQVGTTSQAHSEVLCQRMQKIHFSCAVVGLPWKAKVER